MNVFGYRVVDAFDPFEDGKTNCLVLVPPEKLTHGPVAWTLHVDAPDFDSNAEYHIPPEVFISDGPFGTIVGDWVVERKGIGGIHHMAYQVESVENMMAEAKEKRWFEFSSAEPMRCPGLVQVFTKPLAFAGGMVFEFIERTGDGFCKANVRRLMESTVEAKTCNYCKGRLLSDEDCFCQKCSLYLGSGAINNGMLKFNQTVER